MAPGVRSVAEEVEQSIRILMPMGRASIGEVAHALGTNVRTLQRRRSATVWSSATSSTVSVFSR